SRRQRPTPPAVRLLVRLLLFPRQVGDLLPLPLHPLHGIGDLLNRQPPRRQPLVEAGHLLRQCLGYLRIHLWRQQRPIYRRRVRGRRSGLVRLGLVRRRSPVPLGLLPRLLRLRLLWVLQPRRNDPVLVEPPRPRRLAQVLHQVRCHVRREDHLVIDELGIP